MTTLGIDIKTLSARITEQGHTWKAGETSMTQLTRAEAKKRLGVVPPPGAPSIEEVDRGIREGAIPQEAFVAAAAVGAPSAHDWRNVNGKSYITPVRDQGSCGSCVAFGVAAVLESNLRVAIGNPDLDIDLSEAQLFYCYGRSEGRHCNNGWWPEAALEQCANGLALEQSFPYTAGDQDCSKLDPGWRARHAKVAGKSHLAGAAIKQWIATRGPVTGCFVVYDDFFAYRGGVYRRTSNNQEGGHCVTIVGYDDSQSCWICKNSWGTAWGEQGYFRIGYGECGIDSLLGPYGADGVSLVEEAKAWSGWYSEGGELASNLAVFANADGRLEVFVRGMDNAVWHIWQVQPNGGWSGWSSLGGVIQRAPSVSRNADGRLVVFAKGTDGAVWHNRQAGNGWSGWSSLGGVITSDITVGQNADGRLEIFVRGTDGAVWHKWQLTPSGAWSGWHSLSGVITSEITVERNADGRLEIFVRGTDGGVWHNWQVTPSGAWSGWHSLGGVITSMIAAARNADGRLEIFVRGSDNALWHQWQVTPNGTWSGWASQGGTLTSPPSLGRSPAGRLELFVRGSDNALWHKWQIAPNSGWSDWASEGGVLTGNIAVASNADGRLEVFARGTDRALWHDWQTVPIAVAPTAQPPARVAPPGRAAAAIAESAMLSATGPMMQAAQGTVLAASSGEMPRGDMLPARAAGTEVSGPISFGTMPAWASPGMPAGSMRTATNDGMPRGQMLSASAREAADGASSASPGARGLS